MGGAGGCGGRGEGRSRFLLGGFDGSAAGAGATTGAASTIVVAADAVQWVWGGWVDGDASWEVPCPGHRRFQDVLAIMKLRLPVQRHSPFLLCVELAHSLRHGARQLRLHLRARAGRHSGLDARIRTSTARSNGNSTSPSLHFLLPRDHTEAIQSTTRHGPAQTHRHHPRPSRHALPVRGLCVKPGCGSSPALVDDVRAGRQR